MVTTKTSAQKISDSVPMIAIGPGKEPPVASTVWRRA